MARVSLIVVQHPGAVDHPAAVDEARRRLEGSGHEVEVLAGLAGWGAPRVDLPGVRPILTATADSAGVALAGLAEAGGDLRVVLDARGGYTADDVEAVVRRLDEPNGDVVVASRNLGRAASVPARALGLLFRPLLGSTDPFAGLIGVRAETFREAEARFRPVGTRFALEILARAEGGRADAAIASRPGSGLWGGGVGFGDIRQAKRLADDRFGTASRLAQFCVVGASGMVVDLASYALFQRVFAAGPLATRTAPLVGGPAAPAAAGVVAVAIALTWNFLLNRRLTFNDARGAAILPAYGRYVLSNLAGILLSLAIRLTLPNLFGFFADHRLVAALVGIVAATGVSFSLTRWFVFGKAKPASRPSDTAGPEATPANGPDAEGAPPRDSSWRQTAKAL